MLTPIEREFEARAMYHRGGVMVLEASTACEMIERCKTEGVQILGVDVFRILPEGIQPLLEHSTDYSGPESSDLDTWDAAERHIDSLAGSGFGFEVVVEEEG